MKEVLPILSILHVRRCFGSRFRAFLDSGITGNNTWQKGL